MRAKSRIDRFEVRAKNRFRSTREGWCFYLSLFVSTQITMLPAILDFWSLRVALIWTPCVALLGTVLWEVWKRWGRRRFPLPPDKPPPGPESPFWTG